MVAQGFGEGAVGDAEVLAAAAVVEGEAYGEALSKLVSGAIATFARAGGRNGSGLQRSRPFGERETTAHVNRRITLAKPG
ncbi:hypothetical protein LQ948_13225 [Jiella sp. MQZ9-1]|uniref:Uncharacterized protein n=1 Tax=Jiella flava TaxID=2816857 RepID=A0A939G122_9HYPH|nr:hypothetical protein [Jiella flava]MBO0663598.1 hypothetical protein [Jiella flava]MCD2472173.1 hypothetical protein [Jiella flava]